MQNLFSIMLAPTLLLSGFDAVGVGVRPPEPADVPPLMCTSTGEECLGVSQWESVRRPEILKIFEENVFGVRPVEKPEDLSFSEIVPPEVCMDGTALRKRIRATFSGPGGSGHLDFSAWIPKSKRRVPVFVHIAPRPAETAADPEGPRPTYLLPVSRILSRGYAVVAYYNYETAIDFHGPVIATGGVFKIWGPNDAKNRAPMDWGIISAWAWGASRIMDWIETEPLLDAHHAAVVGLSRNGKTALWTGATDKRFALVVSCCSGMGGAKLNHIKLPHAEDVEKIMKPAWRWFCPNYAKWIGKDALMPFDQHWLLALVAPRLLYVSSAEEDAWAGPRGEFAAASLATPAWELYGMAGLVGSAFPLSNVPLQAGNIAYHVRKGMHDITEYDWDCYMDFADGHGFRLGERCDLNKGTHKEKSPWCAKQSSAELTE